MASTAPSASEIARFRSVPGVSPNATQDEIDKAYRKCARENHPDLGGNTARMADVSPLHHLPTGQADKTPIKSTTHATRCERALRRQHHLCRLLPPIPPASELAAAREGKLAAERAAAEQLAAEEAVWGPDFRSHGTKGRTAPISTTGTAYEPLPQIRLPAPKLGRKRTREEQSLDAPIVPNKRSKNIMQTPAAEEQASTTKSESVAESVSGEVDSVDNIFAAVKWDHPVSTQDLNEQVPDFVAWLEDESAWDWHMCYSEKDGFKLMGSERDREVFLWKYCCATGPMSMAVKRE